MKHSTILLVVFLAAVSTSLAQSHSFRALENKFSSADEVYSFETSGFLARTVLWLAGEHEFNRAIKKVKNIRLITIPKSAFAEQGLSVEGFTKVLNNDAFHELANARDHGDHVVVYLQTLKNSSNNRYFVLIDNPDEVVAVEIKGHIDITLLNNKGQNPSYKL
ncbi:MAG TPA: DUF4252 domain-containing protein [Chryseosolibacter sp.]|nr:DUF4252 domain-containing protein [Chryseosolibacter sp.]